MERAAARPPKPETNQHLVAVHRRGNCGLTCADNGDLDLVFGHVNRRVGDFMLNNQNKAQKAAAFAFLKRVSFPPLLPFSRPRAFAPLGKIIAETPADLSV